MAKIKKNLSLEKHIIDRGMKKATEIFGGNFSSYISYLIYQDTKNTEHNNDSKLDMVETIQENKADIVVKDNEALNELDNILDM